MKKKVNEITKDMTIGEVLKISDDFADVFMGFGMHCLYCPMGQLESLEEASSAHDVDVTLLVKKLNEKLAELKK